MKISPRDGKMGTSNQALRGINKYPKSLNSEFLSQNFRRKGKRM